MTILLAMGGLAVAIVAVAAALACFPDDDIKDWSSFRVRHQVLSEADRNVLVRIEESLNAAPERYFVFPKVTASCVLHPSGTRGGRRLRRLHHQFRPLYFDFVICRAETLEVVCTVLMGDQPGSERLALLLRAAEIAGLPALRIDGASGLDQEALLQVLQEASQRSRKGTPAKLAAWA